MNRKKKAIETTLIYRLHLLFIALTIIKNILSTLSLSNPRLIYFAREACEGKRFRLAGLLEKFLWLDYDLAFVSGPRREYASFPANPSGIMV